MSIKRRNGLSPIGTISKVNTVRDPRNFEVMRIIVSSLLVRDNLCELFEQRKEDSPDDWQLANGFITFVNLLLNFCC